MPYNLQVAYFTYSTTLDIINCLNFSQFRSLPGSVEQKELISDADEPLATSPPLELRRPGSGPIRSTIAVPHSLQSPQDRATGKCHARTLTTVAIDHSQNIAANMFDTHMCRFFASDSPQVAQVYVHGNRIPHPHFPDARYFDAGGRPLPSVAGSSVVDPPPAHRVHGPPSASYVAVPPSAGALVQVPQIGQASSIGMPPTPHNIHAKAVIDRERELQLQRDKDRLSVPAQYRQAVGRHPASATVTNPNACAGHAIIPSHSLVPAMATPPVRNLQVATPPHANPVPPQADSLLMLLQRYPVMWQGLLALKTDQAAVQMHFVFGNPSVASGSLPCNSDGSTPPLRIAQRMRLEQTQLEGVARKMQVRKTTSFSNSIDSETNSFLFFTHTHRLTTNTVCYWLCHAVVITWTYYSNPQTCRPASSRICSKNWLPEL